MHDISYTELKAMSVGEIEVVMRRLQQELERRRTIEREQKITAFRKAWGELVDSGIRITYTDDYESDNISLCDWEGFSFD